MSRKPTTAIFLGAGASCPFGFPATNGLLPRTLQALADDSLFVDHSRHAINDLKHERAETRFLAKTLRRILPGWHPKFADSELPLITEILSLVDYSIAECKPLFPGQSQDEMLHIRHLLERAIFEVLSESGTRRTRKQRELLLRFRDWIEGKAAEGCGVITTNYDTTLEQSLFDAREKADVIREFDFGFGWLDPTTPLRVLYPRPTSPRFRWFKLHGSLNWARCPSCEHIYVNPFGDIAFQTFRAETDDYNTCHCGAAARLQLHLVAPSTHRSVRDANLLETWKNALQLLIEADHWILIGYSLPSEDLAIRSLLGRALEARPKSRKPAITVVQWQTTAQARYELIFPGCNYHPEGLEAWLATQTTATAAATPTPAAASSS